jgi:hypothetical protein
MKLNDFYPESQKIRRPELIIFGFAVCRVFVVVF